MEKLSTIISNLCNEKGELKISLKDLQAEVKQQGLGFWIILLSLPSALPVPAPGYSTPLGIILAWIGILLLRNKNQLNLPAKWQKHEIHLSAKAIRLGLKCLTFIEKFVRPSRFPRFKKILNIKIIGLNIFVLACIMALPIPLTNTAPAAVIFLFGMGLLENDGLLLFFCQMGTFILIGIYVLVAIFGVECLTNLFNLCISVFGF